MTLVTLDNPNHNTRPTNRIADAIRYQASSIATRMPMNTDSARTSHTYVTTMLDADADLRDMQIAARHADPRTTMRYDRARSNLDRHPNYILAAYMASGT